MYLNHHLHNNFCYCFAFTRRPINCRFFLFSYCVCKKKLCSFQFFFVLTIAVLVEFVSFSVIEQFTSFRFSVMRSVVAAAAHFHLLYTL